MVSLEQEKQERTKKKQERTDNKQEITSGNKEKNLVTFSEAKKQIFSLIQEGWRYNKICQVSFHIENLGLKRFSISEISKIKNEFLGGSRTDEISTKDSKKEKTEIFQLIKAGVDLGDIVISTGIDPKIVKETFDEYMDLKNLSPNLGEELMKILYEKGLKVYDIEGLKQFIIKMANAYKFFNFLSYTCSICKKPVFLSPYVDEYNKADIEDLVDAIRFLSKTHGHADC